MHYAVVAPGFSAVYTDWSMVERARVFYPYLKWKKTYTAEQASEFIKRNQCNAKVNLVYNYGDTFRNLYITVSYEILSDSIRYTIDTSKVGYLNFQCDGFVIEQTPRKVIATLPNIYLSDESITSHMSVIYNLLQLVGDYVDVNLILPNYSVFYALTFYTGTKHRQVCLIRELLHKRFCKVGFTLKRGGAPDETIH